MTRHTFDSIWVQSGPGRREVAVVCRACGMRVNEPRYPRGSEDYPFIFGQPENCDESVCLAIHES